MPKPLCRPMLVCLLLTIFFGVAPSAIRGAAPIRAAGSATLSGTIWHVPGEFADIQPALDAAASGDTILVAAGSYTGSLNFNGKDVTVQSVAGPTATAIVGNGGTTVMIGPQGALIGFTVSHGVGYDGGGLSVSGTGTVIRGNIFTDNAALISA